MRRTQRGYFFGFFAVPVLLEGAAVAEELSDWSPVVAVVALLNDWSPVVVVVLLLSDWSPVDVVLSMVTLERPRRSIVGLTVEVEPVTDEFTSDEDPEMDDVLLAVDPVADGDEDAVPLVELAGAPAVDGFVDDIEPVVALEPPLTEPVVAEEAALSGMQSMCTGLWECSFAWPVLLSASFPAFGWPSVLQSGLTLVEDGA